MAKYKPRRIYRDDEEPESDDLGSSYYNYPGCSFCGSDTHDRQDCDVRPLSDWTKD